MSTTNNRPERAQWPGFEGWKFDRNVAYRYTEASDYITIERYVIDGVEVAQVNQSTYIMPSTALAIANLIAEDRGGWAE